MIFLRESCTDGIVCVYHLSCGEDGGRPGDSSGFVLAETGYDAGDDWPNIRYNKGIALASVFV